MEENLKFLLMQAFVGSTSAHRLIFRTPKHSQAINNGSYVLIYPRGTTAMKGSGPMSAVA